MSYPILLYITVQRHPTGACHVENLFDQLIWYFTTIWVARLDIS
jgi:hypothetical protein